MGKKAEVFIFLMFFVICALCEKTSMAEASPQHACDFITSTEVGAVMGMSMAEPEKKEANPLGQTICFFDAPQEQGMRFAQVQMVSSASPELAAKGFTAEQLFTNNTGFIEATPVEGVGERALWGGSGLKMGAGLHVYARDHYFVVIAQKGSDQESLAASKKLAEIILSRIE